MKKIQPVIVGAVMLAFVGCDSSSTQNGATPGTNTPAVQSGTPEQVPDAAKAAAPSTVSTSTIVPAPASAPGQN